MEKANKELLKNVLTKSAAERLSRIKISSPVIAMQLEAYLLHVYQSGQLTGKIDDKKLKQIVEVLRPEKKEVKIKTKRK